MTPDRHCAFPSRAHPLDPHSWARPPGGLAIAQGPQLRVDGEAEQESTEISPKRRLTLIMKRTNAVVDAKPTIRRVMWGRRFLASTVVVPPDVAEHLNMDALAVLAVIRNEARTTGKCTLPVARIAERANIGRAKARAAIRLAEFAVEIADGGQPAAQGRRAPTGRSLVRQEGAQ